MDVGSVTHTAIHQAQTKLTWLNTELKKNNEHSDSILIVWVVCMCGAVNV